MRGPYAGGGPCYIHIRLHPAGKEPSVQLCTHTPTLDPPLAQGDASQLDEVPHAGRDDDGLLVRVPCLVVALHLLHHKLGVAQESVLREAVEVEASRGHSGLGGGEPSVSARLAKSTVKLLIIITIIIINIKRKYFLKKITCI